MVKLLRVFAAIYICCLYLLPLPSLSFILSWTVFLKNLGMEKNIGWCSTFKMALGYPFLVISLFLFRPSYLRYKQAYAVHRRIIMLIYFNPLCRHLSKILIS